MIVGGGQMSWPRSYPIHPRGQQQLQWLWHRKVTPSAVDDVGWNSWADKNACKSMVASSTIAQGCQTWSCFAQLLFTSFNKGVATLMPPRKEGGHLRAIHSGSWRLMRKTALLHKIPKMIEIRKYVCLSGLSGFQRRWEFVTFPTLQQNECMRGIHTWRLE